MFNKENRYASIFFISMACLILSFFIGLAMDYNGDQANVFLYKTRDYMADYFNVAKLCSDRNPYMHGGSYPPLAYLAYYLFSKGANYTNMQSFETGRTTIGLTTSNMFTIVTSVLLFLLLYTFSCKENLKKILLMMCIMLSGIFLFSFERGNIIIISVICSTFFLMNYQNEHKWVCEIALLALAIAAALKLYPALFGILLLFDKRYKDSLRCALYGLILIILPFLFFKGGLGNIRLFIRNLQIFSEVYADSGVIRFNFRMFLEYLPSIGFDGAKVGIIRILGVSFDFLLCGFAIVASYFQKVAWKKLGLLVLVLITLPGVSFMYAGMYFFPIIVLFFNEYELEKKDLLYSRLFVMFLNPFQIVFRDHSLTWILVNLSAYALLILLTFEGCILAYDMFRKTKETFMKRTCLKLTFVS